MRSETFRVRVSSVWDKGIVFSTQGVRSFGKEMCEVEAPIPELPWEGSMINGLVGSLSNIHIATRTHAEGHLSQLASNLAAIPVLAQRRVPVYQE